MLYIYLEVEELKMNQMERKKTAADRVDKTEVKKERNFLRYISIF